MKWMSRLILIGAISLLVLSSACNLPAQPPPIPSATLPVEQVTSAPSATNITNGPTPAPAIPITGMDVVSLQCQFCVNDEVHAVLIMSNQAFFSVEDPNSGVTCLSAKEMNGRRILLCRGTQESSFTLNICVDNANCLQFPIKLQPCPLMAQAGAGTLVPTFLPLTPFILTPRNTLVPSTPAATDTRVVTPLPTLVNTQPPEPTSTPEPPTAEPPPTSATKR